MLIMIASLLIPLPAILALAYSLTLLNVRSGGGVD